MVPAGVVIPDLWGKSSDAVEEIVSAKTSSRNPRFVGQVFRLVREGLRRWRCVVIPDLWGKSSDKMEIIKNNQFLSRNPRFVGQVFRPD